MEAWIVSEVQAGAALPGMYPINAENKARYEAFRKGQAASCRVGQEQRLLGGSSVTSTLRRAQTPALSAQRFALSQDRMADYADHAGLLHRRVH